MAALSAQLLEAAPQKQLLEINSSAAGLRRPKRRHRLITDVGEAEWFDQPYLSVAQLIDQRPIGGWLYRILAICALVVAFDGYDTQAIGYVAPALIQEFGASKAALAPVFSAGLVGLLSGSLICSPFADRFGRRSVLIGSTIWFALGALATPLCGNLQEMLVIRFLTGLGLGGVVPNAVSLVGEFAPKRRRATLITIMFCGFSIGAALGGVLASWLVPSFGWRAVFYVGGVGPLLILPIVWTQLPESLRLLVAKGGRRAEVERVLARLGVAPEQAARLVVAEDEISRGFPVSFLFSNGRAIATLLLWVAFFMNLVTLYFMSNWLPVIANEAGVTVSEAVLITALFQVGGTVGAVSIGRATDFIVPQIVLAFTLFCAFAFIAGMGQVGKSFLLLSILSFGAGFCVVGSQIGSNALAGSFYPPAAHSTGVGWALGVGRLGGVVGPILGGLLLSMNASTKTILLLGGIPSVVAAVAIALMGLLSRPTAHG